MMTMKTGKNTKRSMKMLNNYDDPRLSPINEERNRVARAIDDADWDGEFDEADALRQELRHIDALRDKGELYVPNF